MVDLEAEYKKAFQNVRQRNSDTSLKPMPIFLREFDRACQVLSVTAQATNQKERYTQLIKHAVAKEEYPMIFSKYESKEGTAENYQMMRTALLREDKRKNMHFYMPSIKEIDYKKNYANVVVESSTKPSIATHKRSIDVSAESNKKSVEKVDTSKKNAESVQPKKPEVLKSGNNPALKSYNVDLRKQLDEAAAERLNKKQRKEYRVQHPFPPDKVWEKKTHCRRCNNRHTGVCTRPVWCGECEVDTHCRATCPNKKITDTDMKTPSSNNNNKKHSVNLAETNTKGENMTLYETSIQNINQKVGVFSQSRNDDVFNVEVETNIQQENTQTNYVEINNQSTQLVTHNNPQNDFSTTLTENFTNNVNITDKIDNKIETSQINLSLPITENNQLLIVQQPTFNFNNDNFITSNPGKCASNVIPTITNTSSNNFESLHKKSCAIAITDVSTYTSHIVNKLARIVTFKEHIDKLKNDVSLKYTHRKKLKTWEVKFYVKINKNTDIDGIQNSNEQCFIFQNKAEYDRINPDVDNFRVRHFRHFAHCYAVMLNDDLSLAFAPYTPLRPYIRPDNDTVVSDWEEEKVNTEYNKDNKVLNEDKNIEVQNTELMNVVSQTEHINQASITVDNLKLHNINNPGYNRDTAYKSEIAVEETLTPKQIKLRNFFKRKQINPDLLSICDSDHESKGGTASTASNRRDNRKKMLLKTHPKLLIYRYLYHSPYHTKDTRQKYFLRNVPLKNLGIHFNPVTEDVEKVFGTRRSKYKNKDYYVDPYKNVALMVNQYEDDTEFHNMESVKSTKFILDSGASVHVFNNIECIQEFTVLVIEDITKNINQNSLNGINGLPLMVTHRGCIRGLGEFFIVPEAKQNLIFK